MQFGINWNSDLYISHVLIFHFRVQLISSRVQKNKKGQSKKRLLANKIKATVHNNSLPEAVILDKLNYEVTLGSTNTRGAIF